MGGGGKSGKLFVTGDDGDHGPSDALMYFFIFIFKFLLPLCVKPKIPMGFSGEGWGLQVGEATISTSDGNVLFRGLLAVRRAHKHPILRCRQCVLWAPKATFLGFWGTS